MSDGDVTSNTPAVTPCAIVSATICSTRRRWMLYCLRAAGESARISASIAALLRWLAMYSARHSIRLRNRSAGSSPASLSACSQRSMTEPMERSSRAERMASLLAWW